MSSFYFPCLKFKARRKTNVMMLIMKILIICWQVFIGLPTSQRLQAEGLQSPVWGRAERTTWLYNVQGVPVQYKQTKVEFAFTAFWRVHIVWSNTVNFRKRTSLQLFNEYVKFIYFLLNDIFYMDARYWVSNTNPTVSSLINLQDYLKFSLVFKKIIIN